MQASDFQPSPPAKSRTANSTGGNLTPLALIFFSKHLLVLLVSGLPLLSALQLLSEQMPKQQKLLRQLSLDIRNGCTFANSLRQHPQSFDPLYCDLIEIGEFSGDLETILGQLIDERETRANTDKRVRKALFYPSFILVVALLVSCGLLLFVVPRFATIFADFDATLPTFTLAVIALAAALKNHAFMAMALLTGIVIANGLAYRNSLAVRLWWHRNLLQAPLLGLVLRHALQARMAQTLSIALAAGIRLPQALQATVKITQNMQLQRDWQLVIQAVQKGIALPLAFHHTSLFDATSLAMIRLGHETGQIDRMLSQVSHRHRQALAELVERLTQYLEPLIMLVVGGFIAIIMVAMYLPIFQLGQVVS